MPQKKRIRTCGNVAKQGSLHAVGQGRPRQVTEREYTDELIQGAESVPSALKDDPVALAIWNETVAVLVKREILKATHLPFVMLYAQAVSNYFATPDQLFARGLVCPDESGAYRPAVSSVKHQAFQQMMKAGSLLGLDPLSELRTGLIKSAKKEEPTNGFLDLDA